MLQNLHVHQERLDNVDLQYVKSEFIGANVCQRSVLVRNDPLHGTGYDCNKL